MTHSSSDLHSTTAILDIDAPTLAGIAGQAPVASPIDFPRSRRPRSPESTVAELLIRLAQEAGDLFHCPQKTAYITWRIGKRKETVAITSTVFRDQLRRRYFQECGRMPGNEPLEEAVKTLAASALYDGQEKPVYVRKAVLDDTVYLDLGDADGRAVRITSAGWNIVAEAPVAFLRPSGFRELPEPAKKGSTAPLRRLVASISENDFLLLIGWATFVLGGSGSYPHLFLTGTQGSGKSTLAWMLLQLLDPSSAGLRRPPRTSHDLMIAAKHSFLLAYDNLSRIPVELSDTLCALSTGGAWTGRKLYSDDQEIVISAQRPVLLTGIGDLVTADDLADRTLQFTLRSIAEGDYVTDRELRKEFAAHRAAIFGGLLDQVVATLARRPDVSDVKLPRMADFGEWLAALALAGGKDAQEILDLYRENRLRGGVVALEASPVALAVLEFAHQEKEWHGVATDLLEELNHRVSPETRGRCWPSNARALSAALRKSARNLEQSGVQVEFDPSGRQRLIHLRTRACQVSDATSSRNGGSDASGPEFEGDDPAGLLGGLGS